MANNIRGTHVSPGIYTKETDITYAAKSLGITTLGLVGETLKGPAFQPMSISNWADFVSTFGGTSTEKFKGTQYPKYEMPYIAKSYLTQSNQLQAVRVLGLSGYNAGPAWVVTASKKGSDKKYVVAVLRSRGDYQKYRVYQNDSSDCSCNSNKYDALVYHVGEILQFGDCTEPIRYNEHSLRITPYSPLYSNRVDCDKYAFSSKTEETISVSATNLGRFVINGLTGVQSDKTDVNSVKDSSDKFTYAVSLNSYDNDYIANVIGTSPSDGDAPVYVESLYDVSLQQLIAKGKVDHIDTELTFYQVYHAKDYCGLEPVAGPMRLHEDELTRKNIGQRFLADKESGDSPIKYHPYDYATDTPTGDPQTVSIGQIYTVVQYTDKNSGKREYHYKAYTAESIKKYVDDNNKILKPDGNELTLEEINDTLMVVDDGVFFFDGVAYSSETDANAARNESIYSGKTTADTYVLKSTSVMYYDEKSVKEILSAATVEVGDSGFATVIDEKIVATSTTMSGSVDSAFNTTSVVFKESSGATCYSVFKDGVKATKYSTLKAALDTVPKVIKVANKGYMVKNDPSGDVYPTVNDYYRKQEGYTVSSVDTVPLYDRLEYIGTEDAIANGTIDKTKAKAVCVKNLSDGLYYRLNEDKTQVVGINCDLNDYKSSYRFASTPWIVSNLMGSAEHMEVKRLFRFHTISDGNNANFEVKVSIENIKPDDGTFDVVIRDINDSDEYQEVLEKYSSCNLVVGDKNYIAYRIGSYDGMYETKSKYVTVECKEGDIIEAAIPAGFLGYPKPNYSGEPVIPAANTSIADPLFMYNTKYDNEVKNRKQYFGLSTRIGIDYDMFTFKGDTAYINDKDHVTHGFHLDSRLNSTVSAKTTVDGKTGYTFDAVSQNSRTTTLTDAPIIGTEEAMANTIYSYANLRKFTVYFYGGFDGWDEFRTERTNTDDFKLSKYLGTYDKNSGLGYAFDRIDNAEELKLNQNGITSDWYAYLSGIRQFANPEETDINVFATPGIDYVNNRTLVQEAIEMIEEERADSIYVVTTPDKPAGASDYVDEMYTPEDAVYNLEDSEIDSNYTCTYYPWVKYHDVDNKQYIYLPPTKDAVRNFALTDNQYQPWYASAGLNRGSVDAVRAHFVTKLADEDVLYEGRINPVKSFYQDGLKLWGQKNLQVAESQLNRISVRRMLLRLRKLIAIACRGMIFEPNDSVTINTFKSTVTPILDTFKSNRGISDYRLSVEDSAEARDRRELNATIYLKPINSLEFIQLNFVVTPEAVSFDSI